MSASSAGYDVVVVGAGVIGTAVARACARRGLHVAVVDPEPGRGASHAAAGMLAPVTETTFGEHDLLALTTAAAAGWPAFASALEAETGLAPGYRDDGTVVVAHDADDRRALARLHEYQVSVGLGSTRLTSREVRAMEPLVAPDIAGGLLVPGDHSVHNRSLMTALAAAATAAGVTAVRARVAALDVRADGSRACGVVLEDGTRLATSTVVLAAGVRSAGLPGMPAELVPPVRPVKGQILRLRTTVETGPVLTRTLRAVVGGASVYLVPRADGELVVGATSEERGFDTRVTAGGVWELLRDARAVLPVISELELVETWAGLRPTTPDNRPVVGPSGMDGLVLATGHGRHGVLLAPLTGDAVADLLVDGAMAPLLTAADPTRFTRGQVPA